MIALTEFLHVIKSAGLDYTHHAEGVINRCTTNTSKNNAKPAWFLYKLVNNECYGVWGDFRDGITNYFPEKIEKKDKKILFSALSSQEDDGITSLTFNYIFNTAQKPSKHAYLDKKHIAVKSIAELIKQRDNRLIIPVYNRDKKLCGIQYIFEEKQNGTDKRFESGSKQKGSFFYFPSENKEKIIICEGFATGYAIWIATGIITFVAFSSGNIENVTKLVREKYPHQKIIIGADHDKINETTQKSPGLDAAAITSRNVSNVSYVYPADLGQDFNDLFVVKGPEAVKKYFISTVSSLLQRGAKFIKATWLIEPFLESNSMFIIYGQPNHGKSFFALYFALKAANNQPFYHNEFKIDGSVLYICGEDYNGVNRRVKALCDKYQLSDRKFLISTKEVHLLSDEEVSNLIEDLTAIKNSEEYIKLIVIDTLNANFGDGDENKTMDATKFVNACKKITSIFPNSSIGIVHHTGHEHKDRPRGASSLIGAANTMMLVNLSDDGHVYISCTKQKNASKFNPLIGKITNHKFEWDNEAVEAGIFEEISDGNIPDETINEMAESSAQEQFIESQFNTLFNVLNHKVTTSKNREITLLEIHKSMDYFKIPYSKVTKLEELGKITRTVNKNIFIINP